jgi:hypothetical protein
MCKTVNTNRNTAILYAALKLGSYDGATALQQVYRLSIPNCDIAHPTQHLHPVLMASFH